MTMSVIVCKSCLITNVKMFHLDALVAYAYSELTGLQCDDTTSEYVCYQCAALLLKFQQFRTKCLRANKVISEYSKITEFDINTINRKWLNLESNITKHAIKENIFYESYNESKFNKNENKSIKIEISDLIKSIGVTELYDNKDEAVSYKKEPIYLEDDIDVLIVASESECKSELYEDQAVSDENTSLYLEDDINVVVVTNEVKDEEELDDNNQAVSNDNDSSYLEDDISLDENPFKDIRNKTDDESTEVRIRNKVEQGSVAKKNKSINRKGDNSFFDEYMTIVKLTPEEARKNLLLRKESNNYKSNPYTCDFCYRGFGLFLTYENHMKKHNEEYGEYDCEYCHAKFLTMCDLNQHTLYHTRRYHCKVCQHICSSLPKAKVHVELHKGKQYPCDECGKIYRRPHSLLMHKKDKHSSEWVCAMCGSIFAKERGLNLHLKIVHKQDINEQKGPLCEECNVHFATATAWKRHLVLSSKHNHKKSHNLLVHINDENSSECVCALCGSIFSKERGLKLHLTVAHKEETNEKEGPVCEECDVQFATETAWKRHLVLSSKHTVRNGCYVCGESFESEDALKNHAKEHSEPYYTPLSKKPINCNLCDKTFIRRVEYYAHMNMDHPKAYGNQYEQCMCEVCGKVFKNRYFLMYHQRIHTGEKPYSCKECGKRFILRHTLNSHLAAHSSVRVFQCHLCDKAYSTQGPLYKHLKAHFGIRPYKCNVCEKTFPTPCEVKYHAQYVHQKVPWPKRDRSKRKRSAREALSPATS